MSPVRSVTYVSGPDRFKVVRPEGLELSTFWFVARVVKFQAPYCPLLTGVFILESTLSWAIWATLRDRKLKYFRVVGQFPIMRRNRELPRL
jgi:hypothetical protein